MAEKMAVSKGGGVKSVASLGRNGVHDWIIQRVSAVVLLVYVLVIVGFVAQHDMMTYTEWRDFMLHPAMQFFNTLALLSFLAHAWVGMWTILTDYVKPVGIRFGLQLVVKGVLLAYFVWGLKVFWGQ